MTIGRAASVGQLAVGLAVVSAGAGYGLLAFAPASPPELHPPRSVVYPLAAIAFTVLGALVVARHPRNAIGWLLLWSGSLQALQNLAAAYAAFALHGPGAPGGEFVAWLFSWMGFGWMIPTSTYLTLLFPDGRLPSPRLRPLAILAAGATVASSAAYAVFPGPLPIFSLPNPFGLPEATEVLLTALAGATLTALIVAIVGFGSLVWRYRRARDLERQQLKWFAYGAAVLVATGTLVVVMGVPVVTGAFVITLAFLVLAGTASVAVLRYRLYDIDLVINRTLVYGALSGTLVAAYAGSIVLLQALLRPLTGGSEFAVAVSTLFIAALFQPLRRRIQEAVDRRFYRSRYDAGRTIAAFAGRLRQQVHLDALQRELVGVVDETMRPMRVSLWLRKGR